MVYHSQYNKQMKVLMIKQFFSFLMYKKNWCTMIWTLSCPFEPVQVKNDIIIKCKSRLIYFNIILLIIDRNKFMYHNNNEK